MATLTQLKRDADSGRMSVMLLWRFGKTGNDIPREMRGVRKVFRANSVGLVLELNGKESTLYTDSAKLVEYDGKMLTFYRAGYRPPTQNSLSLCATSFCTSRPVTPGIS